MRVLIARCSVAYEGRLDTDLRVELAALDAARPAFGSAREDNTLR